MKMARNMAMVAVGAGAVLAYQKYQEPMKKQMNKMLSKVDKAGKNLEDMI